MTLNCSHCRRRVDVDLHDVVTTKADIRNGYTKGAVRLACPFCLAMERTIKPLIAADRLPVERREVGGDEVPGTACALYPSPPAADRR